MKNNEEKDINEEKEIDDNITEEPKEEEKEREEKEREELRKKYRKLLQNYNPNPKPNKSGIIRSILFFIMVLFVISFVYFTNFRRTNGTEELAVTYTEFTNVLKTSKVSSLSELDEYLYATTTKNSKPVRYSTKKITDRLGNDNNIMSIALEKNINVTSTSENSLYKNLFTLFVSFGPLLIFVGFLIFLNTRIMRMGNGGAGGPFGGNKKEKRKEMPKVKFSDVAGVDEEKEELKEIVEFLKNPDKFTKVGARVPKGVLLLGEPGTGKTLLAKAVAGEAGASFFSISGSEFVELYVGVGAARVRELFESAKKESPAIIFIDEIDAVGRVRGNGRHGGNDEREQTLNQLLVEMDGFDTSEKIIVMAATNRADVLDPALLRAGRFDRRIEISAPDVNGRIEILKIHSKNKKLAEDVKLEDIAKITPGFVGADLENLLNEAAILASREDKDYITMDNLDEAVDKIGMGLGQRSKIISQEDKMMLAYHEGGHALMATLLEKADKVHKVTIIPRGDAGGFMMPLPKESLGMRRKEILAGIKVSLGGRAGEEVALDDIATGAYSDIKKATYYARLLVSKVGMNDLLGPINWENDENDGFIRTVSEETTREIDLQVRELLKSQYEETVKIMKENREKLDKIANLLLEKETITGAEVRALVSGKTIEELKSMSTEELNKFY